MIQLTKIVWVIWFMNAKDKKEFAKKIPIALAKTGFLLENSVAEAFRKNGWGVINGRYYTDDVDGRAKELDIVAYKVKSGAEIEVVTSVLISCKKDEANAWAIMSRKRPDNDPNNDWEPVHLWTNDEILSAYLGQMDWKKSYIFQDKALFSDIFKISKQAFAFQLVSLAACSAGNDKPIFDSISGLMKAQEYEISSLPARMQKKRVYLFNLLTIVDAEIYEANYDSSEAHVTELTEFRHLARYIVNKKEQISRITIGSYSEIKKFVGNFDRLSKHDVDFFNSCIEDAYLKFYEIPRVSNLIAKKMSKKLLPRINIGLSRVVDKPFDGDISFNYDKRKKELVVHLPGEDDEAERVFRKDDLLEKIGEFLKVEARYQGRFRVEGYDIPF
jgi:hypothetical protein